MLKVLKPKLKLSLTNFTRCSPTIIMDSFDENLCAFAAESNILADVVNTAANDCMAKALTTFVVREQLTLQRLLELAEIFEVELRDKPGMDLTLRRHTPPPGGNQIATFLPQLINRANQREDPFTMHGMFQWLHPFTNANGRIGRAIWAWQMVTQYNSDLPVGFARAFYIQALDNFFPIADSARSALDNSNGL